jgi:anti-sigma factor RsiW
MGLSLIGRTGPGDETMEHDEAVQQLAVERYLLDELTSELRDEFEEHMFDCAECALDLRAGAAFVQEAKLQLPQLIASSGAAQPAAPSRAESRPAARSASRSGAFDWFSWFRPAFAVPAFAALVAVIGYQNLSTIPALRAAADSPRIVPWVSFHTGTRGAARLDVPADRTQGAMVVIELSQEIPYASYVFDLYDQQGKRFWTQSVSASSQASGGNGTFSLMIPGAGLQQGDYTLVIGGINPQGARTEVDRRIFNVHFDD